MEEQLHFDLDLDGRKYHVESPYINWIDPETGEEHECYINSSALINKTDC